MTYPVRGALLAAVLLFASFLPVARLSGTWSPDYALLALILLFRGTPLAAIVGAAGLGLLRDVLSASPLGANAVRLTVLALLVARVGEAVDLRVAPVRAAAAFGLTFVSQLLDAASQQLLSGATVPLHLADLPTSAAVTALGAMVLWRGSRAEHVEARAW